MRKMKNLLLFLLISFTVLALQQNLTHSQPTTLWSKLYNGPANLQDSSVGLAVNSGGMLFVTGWSLVTAGNADIVTIRYNPDTGDTMWVNRYSSPLQTRVSAITCDNNFVYITGWSFTPSRDMLTIKYDVTNGNRVWVRTHNGAGNGGDYGLAIAVDAAGFTYVTGRSDNIAAQKITTLKYDPSGTMAAGWPVVYTGPLSTAFDEGHSIKVDASGNVYVTGISTTDYLTLAMSSAGAILWAKKHNGTQNGEDNPLVLLLDNTAANVYVGGYSFRAGFVQDYLVIKYSAATGDSTAAATYNGPASSQDQLTAMAIDASNNVYVTGASSAAGTILDYATLKYNSNLQQQWLQRTTNAGSDIPTSMSLDPVNGNVYVTGTNNNGTNGFDYLTVSYRSDGTFNWEKRENGTANTHDYASSIASLDSDRIFVTGSANFNSIGIAYFTLRYSKVVGINPVSTEIPSSFSLKQNYPNPFNPVTSIRFDVPKASIVKISVYDIIGREVEVLANENISAGTYEVKWDAAEYSSGIYFYTISAGDFRETKKMILTK